MTKSIYVKDIPEDIAEFVLIIQLELKCSKQRGKYSQGQTVIHIIKEYKKIINAKK